MWFKLLFLLAFGSHQITALQAPTRDREQLIGALLSIPSERNFVECLECRGFMDGLVILAKSNLTLGEKEIIAIDFCIAANLFPPDVCEGMVNVAADEVVYVLNNTIHDLETICDFFFGVCDSPLPGWSITVPGNKPQPTPRIPNQVSTPYRILHLSDTHYDPLYEPGTPAECDHPMCCRPWGDDVPPDAELAGYWGAEAGKCDAPLWTFEAALREAVLLQPDIIYVTGDLPPHDVWVQSHDSIMATISNTSAIIREYFPDTPIAYTLGNHESAPVNSFAVPDVYADGYNMDYLYTLLTSVWGDAGVPEEAMDTVQQGGYYSWSPTPGLRIISLNELYGHNGNWFLLINDVDPTGQLSWLTSVLQQAEEQGEKVHILTHITMGSLLPSWSHEINRIISRFESTVTAVFAGHTHSDHFQVLWDTENNTRPVNVVYKSPNLDSDGKKSPSFRLYEVDGGYPNATWEVLDTLTYSLNLTEANLAGADSDAAFPLAYSARNSYGLTDLSPGNWADLAWAMASDTDLFNEYLRHKYSFLASPSELLSCDDWCKAGELCNIYSGDAADAEPCQRIREEVLGPETTVGTTAGTTADTTLGSTMAIY